MQKEIGLEVFKKKDSQEICFIPDNDHGAYIKKYSGREINQVILLINKERLLGTHKGIVYYTIGQRKGLGISTW